MRPAHEWRYNNLVGKLYEWRDRYALHVYPEKVITNLFYKLSALELLWQAVAPDMPHATSGSEEQMLDKWQSLRSRLEQQFDSMHQQALPRVQDNMLRRREVAGVRYDDILPYIRSAAQGDHTATAEVECRFLFYGLTTHLVLDWMAARNCGLSEERAYAAAADRVVGGLSYTSLPEVVDGLGRATSIIFFGSDSGGGFQGGRYQPLPPRS